MELMKGLNVCSTCKFLDFVKPFEVILNFVMFLENSIEIDTISIAAYNTIINIEIILYDSNTVFMNECQK